MASKYKIKFLIITLILIILSSVIASQFASASKSSCDTKADNGLRIISLSPNITEILFALDLDKSIVGVTSFCNYPLEARGKPIIGSTTQINYEEILLLKPTIAFSTSSPLHQSFKTRLESIGCRSIALNVERLENIYASINTIAKECKVQERGIRLVENIKSRLHRISEKCQSKDKPKVLVVIQQQPLIVAAHGTYIEDLIETLGAINAVEGTDIRWPQINNESLILFAPDIIIEAVDKKTLSNGNDEWKKFYQKWQSIPAVKNNKIFAIDADIISRPSPRVIEAAEIMYDMIYRDNKTFSKEQK